MIDRTSRRLRLLPPSRRRRFAASRAARGLRRPRGASTRCGSRASCSGAFPPGSAARARAGPSRPPLAARRRRDRPPRSTNGRTCLVVTVWGSCVSFASYRLPQQLARSRLLRRSMRAAPIRAQLRPTRAEIGASASRSAAKLALHQRTRMRRAARARPGRSARPTSPRRRVARRRETRDDPFVQKPAAPAVTP